MLLGPCGTIFIVNACKSVKVKRLRLGMFGAFVHRSPANSLDWVCQSTRLPDMATVDAFLESSMLVSCCLNLN